jgi:hypothetical protein
MNRTPVLDCANTSSALEAATVSGPSYFSRLFTEAVL